MFISQCCVARTDGDPFPLASPERFSRSGPRLLENRAYTPDATRGTIRSPPSWTGHPPVLTLPKQLFEASAGSLVLASLALPVGIVAPTFPRRDQVGHPKSPRAAAWPNPKGPRYLQ